MRNDNRGSIILGSVTAICVVFFWSGWIVISRLGVTGHLTVYDLTGLRHGVGAVVALPYIIWSRAWRGLTPLRTFVLILTAGRLTPCCPIWGLFTHRPPMAECL